MKFLANLLIFFGVALAIGFGLSFVALENGSLFGTFRMGPWAAWAQVGVANPDPYTRAYISRTNALELARAEGLRFSAVKDSDGQPLLLQCNYRIDGMMPESSFWTLVATDGTGALAVPEYGLRALASGHIQQFDDGRFLLRVGPDLAPGNWLETSGEGKLVLVLTLYDTNLQSGLVSGENSLPAISRESCR